MAQYEVLEDTVIGTGLAKAGSIVEYDGKSEGKPGPNLRLMPVKGKAAKGNQPVKTVTGSDIEDGAGLDEGEESPEP